MEHFLGIIKEEEEVNLYFNQMNKQKFKDIFFHTTLIGALIVAGIYQFSKKK